MEPVIEFKWREGLQLCRPSFYEIIHVEYLVSVLRCILQCFEN